jgi:hypothetical protein
MSLPCFAAVEDLKQNTEYTGFTGAAPIVQWFWDVVRNFSKEDQARLLQFTTGTSKVRTAVWCTSARKSPLKTCKTSQAVGEGNVPSLKEDCCARRL